MIDSPVRPVMSDSTFSSLRFICVRAFCMCRMCWAENSTSVARCRMSARNTAVCSSGRNAAASKP